MPGTKIINVQKGDSFDEVLDAFQKTDAQEVIFIFPKGTMFGREASYFESLKQSGLETGKTINVMTTDPIIAHMVTQQGLGLLQTPAPRARKSVQPAPAPVVQPEPEVPPTPSALPLIDKGESEGDSVIAQDPTPEYPMAELAVARRKAPPKATITPAGRKIEDITTDSDEEAPVPISRTAMIPKADAKAEQPTAEPTAPANTDIEKLWAEEEQRQGTTPPSVKPARGKISRKFIFIPVIAAILILLGIVYATVGSAKIVINPKTQDIDLKLKITASASTDQVSAEFNSIPGQQFVIEKTASGSYPSTSTKEVAQQAKGNVTIYNKSSTSQRLVATTRLETKGGLIFHIPSTIEVPANGSIDSAVYADHAGKEYNIGPSDFTIPGFKDTPRYNDFSAKSTTPMTGGIVGTAKVVAEQDFTRGLEELSAQAKDQVSSALKEQTGSLKILEDIKISVDAPVSNAKVGEAADTLTMGVKASATVIGFQESDVIALITAYISKNGEMELVQKNLDLSYTVVSNDPTSKKMVFEVKAKGKAAAKIDTAKVLKDIMGLNKNDVTSYFEKMEERDKVKITLSPFWVTHVPKNPKKVHLVVEIL